MQLISPSAHGSIHSLLGAYCIWDDQPFAAVAACRGAVWGREAACGPWRAGSADVLEVLHHCGGQLRSVGLQGTLQRCQSVGNQLARHVSVHEGALILHGMRQGMRAPGTLGPSCARQPCKQGWRPKGFTAPQLESLTSLVGLQGTSWCFKGS